MAYPDTIHGPSLFVFVFVFLFGLLLVERARRFRQFVAI